MTYFTKSGFEKIQKEFKDLQNKRPKAVDELQRARELGDLSENGAYKAARFELSTIDAKIRRIERQLKTAKVISAKTDGTIGIGNKVKLLKNGKEIEYSVVGDFEADPQDGKISLNSPIGQALYGKRVNESVTINAPAGSIEYKIISVK
ncbi:transcription elongation factor GreA [Candidatus Gottesmanbacteria bacterium]|nr:transcription elongation factor GreA [Candidatus Gottesmanbacteria bacterium]